MTGRSTILLACALLVLEAGCGARDGERGAAAPDMSNGESGMNTIARSYVLLALALGRHDKDYVDAYFGPPELKEQAERDALTVEAIGGRARALLIELEAMDEPREAMERSRRRNLAGQLRALAARVDLVGGRKMTFDEESHLLYDAVAPTHRTEHFEAILERLDAALPGAGAVADRFAEYRKGFIIPPDRLDRVFQAAIAACRERTSRHIPLPQDESFTVEYVTDKSWSGYNWYQGNFKSLIQVNTDLPIYIDRAVDLACHEGYPGHHLFHTLQDMALVKKRGWIEYTIYPLFAPQSLIAEGSANYGVDLTFPEDERVAFEREVLFPLAGLDPGQAAQYYAIEALRDGLKYAGNEAARGYLDGTIDARRAIEWLKRYSLMTQERAEQRLRFIEQYRSYVINYNLGEDVVRRYVESRSDGDGPAGNRWKVFREVLASPMLPSDLQ